MKLFDAHTHLQDERLLPQIDTVMTRAAATGVERMVSCGSSDEDWQPLAELAVRYSAVIPSFGVHPWYAWKRCPDWKIKLTEFLRNHPAAGVGEIGLDFATAEKNEQEQRQVFVEQLALARDLNRPVSIHCRKAWPAMLETLQSFCPFLRGFVVHSFSGTPDSIPRLLDMGGYFSFSGSITWPRNTKGPIAAAAVPADRLLIETDSPDILPHMPDTPSPERKLNEPANLVHVLRRISAIRNIAEEKLAQLTFENAERLFGPDRG